MASRSRPPSPPQRAAWFASALTALFACALAIAVYLRLASMEFMEFKSDEYLWLTSAYANVRSPVLAGPAATSVGLAFPPLFVYLLSLPVLLSPHPLVAAYFIALLNVGGLGVLYVLLRRALEPQAALAATALFASAPWTIVFSRKIWNPDALFPFLVLAYLLFFSSLWRPRRLLPAAFVAFALASQLHMSAWFLPLAFLGFAVVRRPRLPGREVAIGAALFFLLYVPYLAFHVRTRFGNLAAFAVGGGGPPGPLVENVLWTLRVSSGLGLDYLLGERGYAAFLREPLVPAAIEVLRAGALVAVAALAYFAWIEARAFRGIRGTARGDDRRRDLVLFFLAVFVSVHAAYGLAGISAYPHYCIVLYPIVPVFIVLFLHDLGAIAPPVIARSLSACLAVLVLSNLHVSASLSRFVREQPRVISGDYGVPFALAEERWMVRLRACLRDHRC